MYDSAGALSLCNKVQYTGTNNDGTKYAVHCTISHNSVYSIYDNVHYT